MRLQRHRCLVPDFDGASSSHDSKEALWDKFYTAAPPRRRQSVEQWKQRETVADLPTGPKRATSTLLSIEEEAIIVAFRRHTLLSLDDCLYALQPTIPHLTRSSLHR